MNQLKKAAKQVKFKSRPSTRLIIDLWPEIKHAIDSGYYIRDIHNLINQYIPMHYDTLRKTIKKLNG